MSRDLDVAIIGAGPAGLAAGALVARAGLKVCVFDENTGPGGQIYRAITQPALTRRDLLGEDYWDGQRLTEEFGASGASLELATTVWSLDDQLELGIVREGRAAMIRVRQVIIATGALERPFPIPGWTLPGVMSVGAAQTLLKSSGLVASDGVVLAGSGPLLWLYAAQTLRAGGRLSMILDTTPRGAIWREIRHAPAFIASRLFRKGLGLLREVRSQVPVVRHVVSLRAEGTESLERIHWQDASGRSGAIDAQQLLLHQGVVPNVNLAMSAGVKHRWDDTHHCWVPELDAFGRSSVAGVLIAGDGAGIAGAWAAEARGRLAAMAAVRDLVGPLTAAASDAAERQVRHALQAHTAGRNFIDRVYQAAPSFRMPEGDTIVCRCEEVTAAQVRDTVRLGCEGPNQMKSFLRCGMGPCQGRLCGLTVTELIAAERGVAPEAVGHYRVRPPVKPIPLSALAAIDSNDDAVRAVVRG